MSPQAKDHVFSTASTDFPTALDRPFVVEQVRHIPGIYESATKASASAASTKSTSDWKPYSSTSQLQQRWRDGNSRPIKKSLTFPRTEPAGGWTGVGQNFIVDRKKELKASKVGVH